MSSGYLQAASDLGGYCSGGNMAQGSPREGKHSTCLKIPKLPVNQGIDADEVEGMHRHVVVNGESCYF